MYSVILTGVALLIVGGVKGKVVRKHVALSALETLVISGIAAALTFFVGYFLQGIAH